MPFQEKKIVVDIISNFMIFGGYGVHVYDKYQKLGESVDNDLVFWAKTFLILIPVSIAVQILITIIFGIFHKISTKEDPDFGMDERDKLIELKASRISAWGFILGFLAAMILVVMGKSTAVMFITIALSGYLGSLADNISRLVYYRRGL